jgi:hypothetical protein
MSSVPAEGFPVEEAAPEQQALSRAQRLARFLAERHRLAIGAALVVMFAALCLAFIHADPPQSLPNHARALELFTDPPAKSYEARNWALFGQWSTSPADNYQFWRIQAPMWVYPIAGFYKLFGVGYAQMRVFSTLSATAGLVLFLLLAAQRLRGLPYLAAGSFLTFNFYYVVYGRSGLLEALLNTFVLLAILCLHHARRHLGWLLVAEWALVASFLTKQSGLYLLPVCLVAGALAMREHRRRGGSIGWLVAPVVQGIAVAAGMAWYVFRPAYWRTVSWNYGHMLFKENSTTEVNVGRFPLSDALRRLVAPETWGQHYAALFPIAGVLSLIGVGRVIYLLARRRRADAFEVLVAGWLAASFGVLLLTPLTAVHYRLILFPPAALMGALTLAAALDTARAKARPKHAAAAAVTLLLADFGAHAFWYGSWIKDRSYDIVTAAALLREAVRFDRGVYAGTWAGPLVFETKSKYYYLKAYFNEDAEAIAQLNLTHLLEIKSHDAVSARLWVTHPEAMKERRLLLSFDLRGETLNLYWLRRSPRSRMLDQRPAAN